MVTIFEEQEQTRTGFACDCCFELEKKAKDCPRGEQGGGFCVCILTVNEPRDHSPRMQRDAAIKKSVDAS